MLYIFFNSAQGTEWNKWKFKKWEESYKDYKTFCDLGWNEEFGMISEVDGLSEISGQAAPDLQREGFH